MSPFAATATSVGFVHAGVVARLQQHGQQVGAGDGRQLRPAGAAGEVGDDASQADRPDIARAAAVDAALGRVHVVVNNAGVDIGSAPVAAVVSTPPERRSATPVSM